MNSSHAEAASRDRVLVLRALGLGDLLAATPALRALRRGFSNHRITLCTPGALRPLAMAIGVDEVIDTAPLATLGAGVRSADVAVNLHGRGPESHRVLLDAHPRRLVAFAHDAIPQTARFPTWRAGEHEVDRWCRLLRGFGLPTDPADLRIELPGAGSRDGAMTLIHPGAGSIARRWPIERWAEVAGWETDRGHRVVVTGGPDEVDIAFALVRMASLPPDAVSAGRTDIAGLAHLVARAGRVLSGDTGIAHLAVALGTPTVTLFGPTPPSLWGPPAVPRHVALWAGRIGDAHGDVPDPGLLDIGVEEVRRAIRGLGRLASSRPHPSERRRRNS